MKMHDRLLSFAKRIIDTEGDLYDAVEARESIRQLIEGYELPYGKSEADRRVMAQAVAVLVKRFPGVLDLVIAKTKRSAELLGGGDAWPEKPDGFDVLSELSFLPEAKAFLILAVRQYQGLAQAEAFAALYRCDRSAAIRFLQSIDVPPTTLDLFQRSIGGAKLAIGECGVVAIRVRRVNGGTDELTEGRH
jgi:hypothetical protein